MGKYRVRSVWVGRDGTVEVPEGAIFLKLRIVENLAREKELFYLERMCEHEVRPKKK